MVELITGIGIGLLVGILITYVALNNKKQRIEQEYIKLKYELQNSLDKQSKLNEIEKKYEETFKNLSNEILDKKMAQIKDLNESELIQILKPLERELKEFREKVENTNKESIERNTSLAEKILNLEKLGLNITEEANKLTKALKTESKTQGTWGEIILEKILEQAGLRNGIEYVAQGIGIDVRDDDNVKLKPDFMILLPGEKHIIIDSKVSIKHYEEYINCESKETQAQIGKSLVNSIRSHITNLESKHYERREGVNSPDFVLMFVPIDNIFNIVSNLDPEILRFSWAKKIAIVTPVTLMYILWLIGYIWKQENQSKNVALIAKKSGEMYDKFVLLIETLSEIGKSIDKTKDAYERAIGQLSTGKGNLIRRAEEIRDLGADNKKLLSD